MLHGNFSKSLKNIVIHLYCKGISKAFQLNTSSDDATLQLEWMFTYFDAKGEFFFTISSIFSLGNSPKRVDKKNSLIWDSGKTAPAYINICMRSANLLTFLDTFLNMFFSQSVSLTQYVVLSVCLFVCLSVPLSFRVVTPCCS